MCRFCLIGLLGFYAGHAACPCCRAILWDGRWLRDDNK